jgi:lipoprotein NlpD
LLSLSLAGCGNTRYSAPVRDTTPKPRPVSVRPWPPVPPGFYRVQAGDTLFKIAFENGLDFQTLAEWNKLADPDRIEAGAVLRLNPPAPAVMTQSLPPQPKVSTRSLPAEPTVAAPPDDAPPDRWAWPGRGELLTRFGDGLSKGIDIAGARGEHVQAAAQGKVAYTGVGLRGYGKLIIIRHGRTLLSAYAHNASILVKEGQDVARGQIISEMGDTDTDRVKLHFEIREYGKPVDPLNYLPRLGQPPG